MVAIEWHQITTVRLKAGSCCAARLGAEEESSRCNPEGYFKPWSEHALVITHRISVS